MKSIDPIDWLSKKLQEENADLVREMVREFAQALVEAEVDSRCGAPRNVRSEGRTNRRNGYRPRRWDTRAGSIDIRIPRVRKGSYFPDWLLEPRKRAEKALTTVVAEAYLLGVSTRSVDDLVQTMGIDGISKSQVPRWPRVSTRWSRSFATAPSKSIFILIFGSMLWSTKSVSAASTESTSSSPTLMWGSRRRSRRRCRAPVGSGAESTSSATC